MDLIIKVFLLWCFLITMKVEQKVHKVAQISMSGNFLIEEVPFNNNLTALQKKLIFNAQLNCQSLCESNIWTERGPIANIIGMIGWNYWPITLCRWADNPGGRAIALEHSTSG